MQIDKQLRRTEGVVRFGLRVDFKRKRFWTYSVWVNADAIRSFVTTEPHSIAVKKFSKWAGEGAAFVQWTNPDGKVDWAEGDRQLTNPTFYYHQ